VVRSQTDLRLFPDFGQTKNATEEMGHKCHNFLRDTSFDEHETCSGATGDRSTVHREVVSIVI
jgi:hypothetical protein